MPAYEVRLARVGEEDAICAVCRAGFAASSDGLLPPATVERQAREYYDPERVRREITTAGDAPGWLGYVVAVSEQGEVLGAAGGGVTDGTLGHDEGGAPASGFGGEGGAVVLESRDGDEGDAGTDGAGVVGDVGDDAHLKGHVDAQYLRQVGRVEIHAA